MKKGQLSKRQTDRFTSIGSYSERYFSSSLRPSFFASDLRSSLDSRSRADLCRDSLSSEPATKSIPKTANQGSQSGTSNRNNKHLTLKPMEVLLQDFEGTELEQDKLFLYAFSLRADGKFQSSAEQYSNLLSLAPTHSQARINLGVCHLKTGHVKAAKEIYEKGLDLGCQDYRLLHNLAIVYIMEGENKKAKSVLERINSIADVSEREKIAQLLSVIPEKIESEGGSSIVLKPIIAEENSPQDKIQKPSPKRVLKTASLLRRNPSFHDETQNRGLKNEWGQTNFRKKHVHKPSTLPYQAFRTVDEDCRRPGTSLGYGKPKTAPRNNRDNRQKSSFVTTFRLPRIPPRVSEMSIQAVSPDMPLETASTTAIQMKNTAFQRVHLCGSLVEEDLEDERTLRQAEVDPALVFSVKAKAFEVANVLRKEAERLHSRKDLLPVPDLNPILPYKLSAEAFTTARGELNKNSEDRDCELLVKLLSKLKFFSKFQTDVRMEFLRIGHIRTFPQGQIIFNQGDPGEFMYVILHGSVTVKRSARDFGTEPIIVNTLYDGDSFGELTLFGSQIQGSVIGRTAACIAAERTDLLTIEKEDYHTIMMHAIETQLDTKINFLVSIPFLHSTPKFNLIPLASNMEPRTYNFNQMILEKGEEPMGLYIILSGHCNVYSEGFCLRPKKLQGYASARVREERPESFLFGKAETNKFRGWKRRVEEEYPSKAVTPTMLESNPGLKERIQSFLHITDVESMMKEWFITQEKILKGNLKERDFFGGRVLVETVRTKGTELQRKVEPCKYSIIAESAQVKIFLITRTLLPLLGEKLMEQMKTYLMSEYECDCPKGVSDEDIAKEFHAWNAYKAQVIDEARRTQFLSRSENKGKSAQDLL